MGNPEILHPAPDVDEIISRDYSSDGLVITFRVETSLPVSEAHARHLERLLAKRKTKADREAAYGFIYGMAKQTLNKKGQAHAVLQATFGIIEANVDKAQALERSPVAGIETFAESEQGTTL